MSIDFAIIAFIALMVLVDLFIRHLAFGRVESVAVDVSVFAFGYSASALLPYIFNRKYVSADGSSVGSWVVRSGIGLLIILVLAGLHKTLSDILNAQIAKILKERDWRKNDLEVTEPLIRKATLLALSGPGITGEIRAGKRGWRQAVADYINLRAPNRSKLGKTRANVPAPDLTEVDLLLPSRLRYLGLFSFAVLGTVSALVPAVTFG